QNQVSARTANVSFTVDHADLVEIKPVVEEVLREVAAGVPPPSRADWVPPPSRGADWVPPPSRGADWVPPPSRGADWVPPPSRGADWVPPPSRGAAAPDPSEVERAGPERQGLEGDAQQGAVPAATQGSRAVPEPRPPGTVGVPTPAMRVDVGLCKVSAVGVGMRTHTGVAAQIFRALAGVGIYIENITTSEIKISCILPQTDGERAMRAVHAAFGLGTGEGVGE